MAPAISSVSYYRNLLADIGRNDRAPLDRVAQTHGCMGVRNVKYSLREPLRGELQAWLQLAGGTKLWITTSRRGGGILTQDCSNSLEVLLRIDPWRYRHHCLGHMNPGAVPQCP